MTDTVPPADEGVSRLSSFFHRQRNILSNAIWLFADRGIRMAGGLVVGVWVARYLGPDSYGLFNYATAFVALFSSLATLGLDRLVIRDVVLHPEKRNEILGTAFALKLTGGFVAQISAVVAVHLVRHDWQVTLMVAIASGMALTQAFDVVDFWFQSQVQSKYSVFARNGAFVVFCAVKIALILMKAPVMAFTAAAVSEFILASAVLLIIYRARGGRFFSWRFRRTHAMKLLHDGWPLLVAYMAYLLYAKIDQIMIGSMVGDRAQGIYSAASKISEIPVAILLIVGSSLFPKFVDLYEKDRKSFFEWYGHITGAMTWTAGLLFLFILGFGDFAVHLLFGAEFTESASVLNYQAVGLIFMFNGALRSGFLTISGNQKILSATTVISAFFNVGLNMVLIPRYGIYGAATAGVLVQFLSLFLLNLFFRPTRPIFNLQLRGLLFFPFLWKILSGKK
jgi:O-antigen/teichoic acid export membrane protein